MKAPSVVEACRGRRWRVRLVVSLSVGVYVGAVQQSIHGLLSHERWNWTDMAVVSGAWAVVWLPAQLLGRAIARRGIERGWISKSPARRRRDREQELIRPAIEAGTLPPDAEPQTWGPALRSEGRELNTLRWVTGVWLAAVSGLTGTAAAVANDDAWGVWTVAGLVMAEAVVAHRLLIRRLRVVRCLLAGVPERR